MAGHQVFAKHPIMTLAGQIREHQSNSECGLRTADRAGGVSGVSSSFRSLNLMGIN